MGAKDLQYLQFCVAGAKLFSTCSKAQYFAIVVDRFGKIRGTGYNGSPKGMTHCNDGGCPRVREQTWQGGSYANCVAVHAEANALLLTKPEDQDGGTLYVNGLPCWECTKLICNTELARVVYSEGRSPVDYSKIASLFEKSRIDLHGIMVV